MQNPTRARTSIMCQNTRHFACHIDILTFSPAVRGKFTALKCVGQRHAHWFVSESTDVKDSGFEYITKENPTTTGFSPKFLIIHIYG